VRDIALVLGGIAGYELANRCRRWLGRRKARRMFTGNVLMDEVRYADYYVEHYKDAK
jgi:hypothetical protein